MKIISFDDIVEAKIDIANYYQWIEEVLLRRNDYLLPTKTHIALNETDYVNVMPCAMPVDDDVVGVKIITRNKARHQDGGATMDSQIFLYSRSKCEPIAILDGNYITTMRTAAVAVHTFCHMRPKQVETIAMLGLGNIGTVIADMLLDKLKDDRVTIKLYQYKDHAERLLQRYGEKYPNITFKICDNYADLMRDSDVVFSSVSYTGEDFCSPDIYKEGVLVIPVHLRGFMECDKVFDNIIVSDLERAKNFQYFNQMKKVTLTDDILLGKTPARASDKDRIIVYNLGLAITDMYYAKKLYDKIGETKADINLDLAPKKDFYV